VQKAGVTMIIIAHRLSMVRTADNVVVLQNGTVAETRSLAEMTQGESWRGQMPEDFGNPIRLTKLNS
jgi:ABC-type multidrug transport system fused ATPase/permease subunit